MWRRQLRFKECYRLGRFRKEVVEWSQTNIHAHSRERASISADISLIPNCSLSLDWVNFTWQIIMLSTKTVHRNSAVLLWRGTWSNSYFQFFNHFCLRFLDKCLLYLPTRDYVTIFSLGLFSGHLQFKEFIGTFYEENKYEDNGKNQWKENNLFSNFCMKQFYYYYRFHHFNPITWGLPPPPVGQRNLKLFSLLVDLMN